MDEEVTGELAHRWPSSNWSPTTIRSESLRSYVRPEHLQLATALIYNPTLTIPFLAMEGGTYSSIYPGVFAFDGGLGRTDLSKKDSLAYPYDPQTSEEVGSLSRVPCQLS